MNFGGEKCFSKRVNLSVYGPQGERVHFMHGVFFSDACLSEKLRKGTKLAVDVIMDKIFVSRIC